MSVKKTFGHPKPKVVCIEYCFQFFWFPPPSTILKCAHVSLMPILAPTPLANTIFWTKVFSFDLSEFSLRPTPISI